MHTLCQVHDIWKAKRKPTETHGDPFPGPQQSSSLLRIATSQGAASSSKRLGALCFLEAAKLSQCFSHTRTVWVSKTALHVSSPRSWWKNAELLEISMIAHLSADCWNNWLPNAHKCCYISKGGKLDVMVMMMMMMMTTDVDEIEHNHPSHRN